METIVRINPMKAFIFVAYLCLSMVFAGNAAAAVLAGWYDFTTCMGNNNNPCQDSPNSKTADVFEAGVTATLYGGDGTRTDASSTDGTFGPTISTGPGDSAAVVNGGINNYTMVHRPGSPQIILYFTVTNNTGFDIVFETLDFDAANLFGNASAQGESLEHISGDLNNDPQDGETIPDALAGAVTGTATGDWTDLSFDFTGFGDRTLANGESTVFGLFVSQGAANPPTNFAPIAIDNIGLIGTVLSPPPPALPQAIPLMSVYGLGLLAGLLGLIVFRRGMK